jgi:hypothetical protein
MLLPMEKVVYPQFMFLDDAGNPIRNVSHTAVFNGSDFWRGAYFKGRWKSLAARGVWSCMPLEDR